MHFMRLPAVFVSPRKYIPPNFAELRHIVNISQVGGGAVGGGGLWDMGHGGGVGAWELLGLGGRGAGACGTLGHGDERRRGLAGGRSAG